MSYEARPGFTLADHNAQSRAAYKGDVPPLTYPSGPAAPDTEKVILENAERASVKRFRIHHPPIPMPK
jgi:hypothetical protein